MCLRDIQTEGKSDKRQIYHASPQICPVSVWYFTWGLRPVVVHEQLLFCFKPTL